jgi:hypothetical protein
MSKWLLIITATFLLTGCKVEEVALPSATQEERKEINTKAIAQQPAKPAMFFVNKEQANIRQEGSINSPVVAIANQYDQLLYLGFRVKTSDGRTWYYVQYDDQLGYISSNTGYLQKEKP